MQNSVAEVKLRAERKAGELLSEREKNLGDRPAKNRSHDVTSFPTLEELGIEPMESHRWQWEAKIPEEQFEAYLREVEEANEELIFLWVGGRLSG
jgi:hypothetical protein